MDADGSGAIDADELGAAFKVCVASGSGSRGREHCRFNLGPTGGLVK